MFENSSRRGEVRQTVRYRAAVRGVTFIELMMVVSIIAVLTVFLVTGYRRFESGYRASAALTKVESALHYARNLAIANNCVYHVRFENIVWDPNDGKTIGSPLGATPLAQQAVAIYCFPAITQALTVTKESSLDTNGLPIKWNPTNQTTVSGVTHTNYLIDRTILPPDTYYGVQYLSGGTGSPYDGVLYFKPDGTEFFLDDNTKSSVSLTLFVTDTPEFADDRSLSAGDYATLNANRRLFFNRDSTYMASRPSNVKGKSLPWMKMIQIFGGGMIRVYTPIYANGKCINPL